MAGQVAAIPIGKNESLPLPGLVRYRFDRLASKNMLFRLGLQNDIYPLEARPTGYKLHQSESSGQDNS